MQPGGSQQSMLAPVIINNWIRRDEFDLFLRIPWCKSSWDFFNVWNNKIYTKIINITAENWNKILLHVIILIKIAEFEGSTKGEQIC